MRLSGAAARSLTFVAAMLAATASRAQDAGASAPFRESVTLNTDGTVLKRLGTVRDYVAEERWPEAAGILDEIAATHSDTLVPLAPGRYVPAPEYCGRILAAFPPEGLAAYRRRVDPQARQWLETARARDDRQLLERIVRTAYASSHADDALLLLGERAWSDGAPALARHYWRQLLGGTRGTAPGEPLEILSHPDPDIEPAAVLARIALTHLIEGDFAEAAEVREVLATRHPDATGALAGREGKYHEIVAGVAEEAARWTAARPGSPVETFAGNPQRNGISAGAVDVGSLRWTPLALPEPTVFPRDEHPARMVDQRPPTVHPVLLDRMLLFKDADRIYALDLLTGRPWYEPLDAGGTDRRLEDAVIYRTAVPQAELGARAVGVPHHTLTLSEGRIYARMGSPITAASPAEKVLESALVCFDPIHDEGRLIWRVPASDVGPGWAFEGAPVVGGGRAYVALRRSRPQTTAAVACLDAETGRLLWTRDVCSAIEAVDASFNVVTNHLLTLSDGLVFFSTDLGAIAALDARDGGPRWVVTYPRRPEGERAVLNDPRAQSPAPCVAHGGSVFAAPRDSGEVIAVDARTGSLRWRTPIPEPIEHILGVGQGRVIVTGNSAWGLDAETGRHVWGQRRRNPSDFGQGRGALVDDLVYWPTRAEIVVLDQRIGEPPPASRAPISLAAKGVDGGGNLLVAAGHLVVVTADKLYVLDEQSRVQPADRLTAGAGLSALPAYEAGERDEADGHLEAALTHYQRAAELATEADRVDGRPLALAARTRAYRLLTGLGQQSLADGDPAGASERFAAAADSAPDAESKVSALTRQAAAVAALGDAVEEAAVWQRILSDPFLADATAIDQQPAELRHTRPVGVLRRPARDLAAARISAIIEQHGPDVYRKFSEEAEAHYQSAAGSSDAEALRAVADVYPSAAVASAAMLASADLRRRSGDALGAAHEYQQVIRRPVTLDVRLAALHGLAAAWDGAGCRILAGEVWRQLAEEFPDARLVENGEIRTTTEHFAARLARPEFSKSVAMPLRRAWEHALSGSESVLAPSDTPPDPESAGLLVSHGGLRCVDPKSGEVRWTVWTESPVVWTAYCGPHLLLATDGGTLRAVAPGDGELRWEWSAASASADGVESWREWTVVGGDVICSDGGERLVAIEGTSGRLKWEFSITAGRLGRQWYCGADSVVVQLFRPDRTLVLNTSDGRLIAERGGDAAPWLAAPVRADAQRIAAVTDDKQVVAVRLRDGGTDWTYAGPLSHANVDPCLVRAGHRLLLIADGDTVTELDPATGERRWSRALAARFLPNPADLLAVGDDRLFAAEDGIVRCIRLSDGALEWERHAGAAAGPCRVAMVGNHLTVAPARRVQGADMLLPVLAAPTGRPVQLLSIRKPDDVRVIPTPTSMALVAADRVTGFAPWSESAARGR